MGNFGWCVDRQNNIIIQKTMGVQNMQHGLQITKKSMSENAKKQLLSQNRKEELKKLEKLRLQRQKKILRQMKTNEFNNDLSYVSDSNNINDNPKMKKINESSDQVEYFQFKQNNIGLKIALNHDGDTIINCLYCDKRQWIQKVSGYLKCYFCQEVQQILKQNEDELRLFKVNQNQDMIKYSFTNIANSGNHPYIDLDDF